MSVDLMKHLRYLVLSIAIGSLLACTPGGPGTAGDQDEQPRGRKKRDALLGPARASVVLLGTYALRETANDKAAYREIEAIAEKLLEYRPTRVAIGVPLADQEELDARYAAYLVGTYRPRMDFVDLVALPLAEAMDHTRVWGIDAAPLRASPVDLRAYAIQHDQTDRLEDEILARYRRWFEREREYQATESIEDNLVWINEPRRIADAHGRNLVGEFDLGKNDEYPGADALTDWYNRHLRMFANLQRVAMRDSERILVVIDAAHLSLLRHSIEASPRFELVELNEFLGVPQGAQRQVAPLL